MLDHLSRAFRSFPLFGLVGMKPKAVRPLAVQDLVNVLIAQAQVRILPEGVTEVASRGDVLPIDLDPKIPFCDVQIKKRLPIAKSFGLADYRCFSRI